MKPIEAIRARAAARKGGEAALAALIPPPPDPAALARLGDDRLLAEMTRKVFQAGFNWKVVDAKWDGFERAFHRFDVGRCSMISDDDLDRLLADAGIIRHARKILSVRDNAIFLREFAAERGGTAAAAIAAWPASDHIGLLELLKTRGTRLGGTSGQYFLRSVGKDGFILARDVVAALIDAGAIDRPPTGKRAMRAVQAAFDGWMAESGLSLTQLSRVLALSIDA